MPKINFTTKRIRGQKPSAQPIIFWDEKVPGLYCRLYPTGTRTYWFNWARGEHVKIGDANIMSAEKARREAGELRAEVYKGKDPKEERKQKKSKTFAGYFEEHYKAYILDNHKGYEAALRRYRQLCKDPLIGKTPLSNFTAARIEKYKLKRKEADRKGSTINRDISAITALIKHALDMGHLLELPYKGRIKKYKENPEHPRYLLGDEEPRLREALKARDAETREERKSGNEWRRKRGYKPRPEIGTYSDHLTPLILTAMLTGCRRGELFNLKWQDVNLKKETLTVRAEGAKSGKTRNVPLRGECREVLTTWKQETKYKTPGDYVFPNKEGQRLNNVNTAFKNLKKRGGITDFRFHDLRHHCASMLVQAGVDLYVVKEWLGHSDIKMTERYAHLSPDNLRDAAQKADNHYGKVIKLVPQNKKGIAV